MYLLIGSIFGRPTKVNSVFPNILGDRSNKLIKGNMVMKFKTTLSNPKHVFEEWYGRLFFEKKKKETKFKYFYKMGQLGVANCDKILRYF